jgi:hypothetical protein
MARYTCLFTVAASIETLRTSVGEFLNSLGFDIIYQTEDYVMGREIPGKVAFFQLVVVEVLIDRTTATGQEVQMSFVIKNEELPLQNNLTRRKHRSAALFRSLSFQSYRY